MKEAVHVHTAMRAQKSEKPEDPHAKSLIEKIKVPFSPAKDQTFSTRTHPANPKKRLTRAEL